MNKQNPKQKRIIDAQEIEDLFAGGHKQEEIAKRLKVAPTMLSAKINNSMSLSEARKRGMERAKSL